MSNEEARLEKFEERMGKFMRALRSPKLAMDKRIKAAEVLGESGHIKAIPVLRSVYQAEKKKGRNGDRDLMRATEYALGQFKALEMLIEREPSETYMEALGKEENEMVIDLLRDIALNNKKGKKKRISVSVLNRVAMVLAFSMVFLGILNVMSGSGGSTDPASSGNGGDAQPVTTPESQPAATVEVTAEITPEGPPTAVPTETLTPTPTITPIPDETVRVVILELNDALNSVTEPRGPVELLEVYWLDAQAAGRTTGCNVLQPEIPDDIFIEDNLLNNVDGLRVAQTNVNALLGLVRVGWQRFGEACNSDVENVLQLESVNGLAVVEAIKSAEIAARDALTVVSQR